MAGVFLKIGKVKLGHVTKMLKKILLPICSFGLQNNSMNFFKESRFTIL